MPSTHKIHLPAGNRLTVTADDSSSGVFRRIGPSGSSTGYAPISVATDTSELVGPFTSERQYQIESLVGNPLTYVIAEADQTIASSGGDKTFDSITCPEIFVDGIPDEDPEVLGQLWVDGVTVKVSAGEAP